MSDDDILGNRLKRAGIDPREYSRIVNLPTLDKRIVTCTACGNSDEAWKFFLSDMPPLTLCKDALSCLHRQKQQED